ncbi:hypothetical protein BB560_004526 [Smittium megazygosporum]|uniref:NADH dehydrogenase [ubiquinone] 1 alpha subcomplex subunit 1 n=1 Tax=Smittium megazygosporum TaxID=133381 RepID=A0A2T9Z900_9FUNG|nr:hypothetical protein BB560_004526 [Smittium megazygosporum]
MFTFTGYAFRFIQDRQNEGKPPRIFLDNWERSLMDRDLRLTGTKRGQSDQAFAPEGFKTNSFYRVYERLHI